MIAGADDEGRRPGRIAELRRRLRQLSERCIVDPEVDDKPGLVEHEVFEGDAKRLPRCARGAVAGDDVVGRDGTRRALVVAQMQRHMIRRLIETKQLCSQFDFDAVIGRRVRAQGRLDRRLREDHARRVTKRIGLCEPYRSDGSTGPARQNAERQETARYRALRARRRRGCPAGEGSHGRSRSRAACRRRRADGRSQGCGYSCRRAGSAATTPVGPWPTTTTQNRCDVAQASA